MVLRDLHKLQYSSNTFNVRFWQFLVTVQSDVSNMKHASYIISDMNSEIIQDADLCYAILPHSSVIHSECELRSYVSPNTIECRWQAPHQDFDKKKM